MRLRIGLMLLAAGVLGDVQAAAGGIPANQAVARFIVGTRIGERPVMDEYPLLTNPRGSSLYVRILPRAGGGGDCTFIRVARDTWRWKCPRR
ncbi:MAG TPA: hypothetical protein ENK15_06040 [Thermopetrobacter sp.]|nr:hypothetical protein [Thermopetrobacter sp.]